MGSPDSGFWQYKAKLGSGFRTSGIGQYKLLSRTTNKYGLDSPEFNRLQPIDRPDIVEFTYVKWNLGGWS